MSFDSVSEDIPIWGDLVGATGRQAGRRADEAAARNNQVWDELSKQAPTAEELMYIAPQVGQEGFDDTQTDPALRSARMDALRQMQGIYRDGGLRPEDKSRIAMINNQQQQQEQAQRAAVMQQMQARGMGGSGTELAGQLSAQQGAATRGYLGGMQVAGDAGQRALAAIQSAATMGGSMQQDDLQAAAARNQIREFNARQGTESNRSRSDAYQQRFGNRQGIALGRSGIASQQEQTQRQQQEAGRDRFTNTVVGGAKLFAGGS